LNTRKRSRDIPFVLVVDDVEDNLDLYVEFLRAQGFRVSSAVDAESALELAYEDPPDVVVMDFALPGMDGLEATRRLKADERTSGAWIIVLTAHGSNDDRSTALAAGADDFCTKPCVPTVLLTKILAGIE